MADRYEVHLTNLGFCVFDGEKGGYIEGVWSSRYKARQACDDLNRNGSVSAANLADRL